MLGVGVHGFDGSQVASWICDATLEANMALMHEMSSPRDGDSDSEIVVIVIAGSKNSR